MSVRSLSTLAVLRDAPLPAAGATAAGATGTTDGATAGATAGGSPTSLVSATDALVHAIPSEVLAPYTALVAIVVSQATSSDTYRALRWWLFGVTLLLVGVYLAVSFYRDPGHTRRFPAVETVAAMAAFAAWGLVMPGSPLSIHVTATRLTIVSAVIAIGGAFAIGLLVPTLTKPSRAAAAAPAPVTSSPSPAPAPPAPPPSSSPLPPA
jgi:hypothetical protein